MSGRIVIVGVGGLGSPLALALAASGERLLLVDDDVVDLSNLPRQILYRTADVGRRKVEAAKDALVRRGAAPARIDVACTRFDELAAPALLDGASVCCDGSDNLLTKFRVNDVCVARGLPFVIAGVLRESGQVFPVRPGVDACYRCLFEDLPGAQGPSCRDAGVLGPLCGLVAARQARAALALALRGGTDRHEVLSRVWVFEEDSRRSFSARRRPACAACGTEPAALEEALS